MSASYFFFGRSVAFAVRFFIGFAFIINPVFAEDWQWIRVSPDNTIDHVGWEVLQGKADVKIKEGKISTELKYDDDKYYFHFLIGGTVNKNGQVTVTEIQENTDATPQVLTGTVEIVKNPKASWDYDRIILKGGPTLITLFRIIKK